MFPSILKINKYIDTNKYFRDFRHTKIFLLTLASQFISWLVKCYNLNTLVINKHGKVSVKYTGDNADNGLWRMGGECFIGNT